MGKNIVLIGFMGTGKSSVGQRLAEKLKMKFVDMDREIEKITGLPISQLFRKHGEIRFRSEEKLLAQKLSCESNLVIATGGGVVLSQENIEALRENGILICLEASAEEILKRINRKKGSRPLLKKEIGEKDIKLMLEARETFYACTDFRIDTDNKEPRMVVEEITRRLR
ncbi:MAG: shikimate kinase [Syntrophomonas sp.]|uniref:shikimate kinase n=1 Tax=Syntrophomonas sp. TaxID=2053627 RepID=UPI0026204BC1|nr:shikimate kinase [Syntrophomonas sp.]MDD2511368.1 shikimate kinase [Syntrophomonas sp.]MDD4627506.1 shikimate kinase [Syntrophomonas sp.]